MNEDDIKTDDFSLLFNDFSQDLYKIAWRICGRPEVAEELCQEAFLRYYDRLDRLPGGDEARFWLIRVVKNLAYNYEKRQKRERDAYTTYSRQPQKVTANEGEQAVLTEESREIIKMALSELPYKLRIALILKEYAGYKYFEIARILNITESNVKVRIFRARQHLSRILKKGELHVP